MFRIAALVIQLGLSFPHFAHAEGDTKSCTVPAKGGGPPVCLGIGGRPAMVDKSDSAKNVLGGALQSCSQDPLTGFYRTGSCQTGPEDKGTHTVCAILTQDFLDFTKAKGNDLSTPAPQYGFPGLKAGQRWCLCANRWLEAYQAGKAPNVNLAGTHEKTLRVIELEILKKHGL